MSNAGKTNKINKMNEVNKMNKVNQINEMKGIWGGMARMKGRLAGIRVLKEKNWK